MALALLQAYRVLRVPLRTPDSLEVTDVVVLPLLHLHAVRLIEALVHGVGRRLLPHAGTLGEMFALCVAANARTAHGVELQLATMRVRPPAHRSHTAPRTLPRAGSLASGRLGGWESEASGLGGRVRVWDGGGGDGGS